MSLQDRWNQKLAAMGLGLAAGRLPKGKGPRGRKSVRVSAGAHRSAKYSSNARRAHDKRSGA
jgi:hypothetical protein